MTPYVVRMIRITTIITRPDLAALRTALALGLNSVSQGHFMTHYVPLLYVLLCWSWGISLLLEIIQYVCQHFYLRACVQE